MLQNFAVRGMQETMRRIESWPRWIQDEVARKELPSAVRPMVAYARSLRPPQQRTGAWAKSIGHRIWPSPSLMDFVATTLAIVGSRRGRRWDDRANIAHLLESGWRLAKHGTLKRESGRAAPASRVTGKAGGGVAVGRHPGFQVMEKTLQATEGRVRGYLVVRIPQVARQVWEQHRA